MRTFLPLISGAFASMDLRSTGNSANTIDIEWTCDADPAENDFTVTYQMLRPDNAQSNHPDFAEQTQAVSGANSAQLAGLHGPFEYAVEVCSDAVNSTCGCSSGKFRTAGTAVYVNSIDHYFNGTEGGKNIYGAFFHDDSGDCVVAAELSFGTCDVTVEVFEAASDPSVRQYAGTGSNQAIVAVSNAYRRNFVTFKASFESTLDACWDNLFAIGNNPAMDNIAVNQTIEANSDYRGAPANTEATISAAAAAAPVTSTSSPINLLIMVQGDVFDEHGNNVTDDLGADTGIAMQNQTNFAIQGMLANATTPLNEANVACAWGVTISLDADCAGVESVEGNLSFADDGAGGFTAAGEPGNAVFFMSGQVPAPNVLAGCSVADLEGATATVSLTSFNA